MATFTTKVLSGITAIGATGGGYYSASTNSNFSAYGVAWNTGATPTIANPHTVNGSGTGKTFNWSSTLTGLTPNTLYYVRAYVTSGGTTAYAGGTITGRTLVALPTVTTTALSPITATGATGGGNVTNAGGGTITARGVAYGLSVNPTISSGHTSDGTGTGSFVSSLTGLMPSTTYHVRAYATNSAGTAYGTDVTGITAPNAPHVETIIQPLSPNETGSVVFTNLPNRPNTLRWSGTTTGSTGGGSFTTGVTITGLTIGTYYFSIRSDFPTQPYSPITTVTIKSPSVIPTEFTSTGYDLYYKTGIGDGPALAAYLLWLDAESVIHEEP